MSKKPVIGITPLQDVSTNRTQSYIDFLQSQGAEPIIIPFESDVEQIVQACDGILFSGGPDISPTLYGEKTLPYCNTISSERDALEKSLFPIAFERDLPILGICRGMQFISAMLGGNLYQDLPTEKPSNIVHRIPDPLDAIAHTVHIAKDTPLFEAVKTETIPVNSRHHQAVKKLAPSLIPMAITPDDIIEAYYHPKKRFLWGVQWHPENMYQSYEPHRNIAKAFVEACRK